MGLYQINFAWYLDLTPNEMFSVGSYPVPGKRGLSLCQKHGNQLEQKEVVAYDQYATGLLPPDYCWVCEE